MDNRDSTARHLHECGDPHRPDDVADPHGGLPVRRDPYFLRGRLTLLGVGRECTDRVDIRRIRDDDGLFHEAAGVSRRDASGRTGGAVPRGAQRVVGRCSRDQLIESSRSIEVRCIAVLCDEAGNQQRGQKDQQWKTPCTTHEDRFLRPRRGADQNSGSSAGGATSDSTSPSARRSVRSSSRARTLRR